jgi:drug/metabolite transporter (DMT)-like permease
MSAESSPHYKHYDATLRDWLQLHLVVIAWGFTSVLGKLMTLPAVEVVMLRTALAAGGLALLAMFMRVRLRLAPDVALRFLGNGMLVGAHWVLFFLSVQLANVSVCMASLPTTMLWCTLLEPLFDRRKRISKIELLMGMLMVGAVWLIFRVEFTHWRGFAAGLGAALAGAFFAVINKHQVAREHFAVISCYQMIGACVATLIALPFFAEGGTLLHKPTMRDLLCLLVLSQVCTVGAYAAYMDVLRRLSVFTVNVAYNLEPVYGIVLAALIFGDTERMSGGFYLGTSIIIGAVIALPFLQRRSTQ